MRVVRDRAAEPRLPHERDESADSQTGSVVQDSLQAEVGKKAFDDVRAGRVDTDRGPVIESLRRSFAPAPAVPPAELTAKRSRKSRARR
jgi:hypothetical protein